MAFRRRSRFRRRVRSYRPFSRRRRAMRARRGRSRRYLMIGNRL